MRKQLATFSQDPEFFSEYKVRLSASSKKIATRKILDFGAGIGSSLPFLRKYFADAEIYATDISEKSLEQIRSNYDFVRVLLDEEVNQIDFDLIFVACVFHHVERYDRPELLVRLSKLLTKEGGLHIFEHNPWNPITRRMVSTCPFDKDAVLIRKSELASLIQKSTSLRITDHGYCLFFPPVLRRLICLERLLRWMPIGGQYYVFAGHQAAS